MEQDTDGAFGAVQDLPDLSGTQAIGEPQQDNLAPVVGQGGHRGSDAPSLLRAQREAGRVGIRSGGLERDRVHRLGAPS